MGNRVVILGAGESGTGAALLAKAKGYDVFISDVGQIADSYKQQLVTAHIEFEEGQHSHELILNADLVIKSPGIPENIELIKLLRSQGVEVIDELEFASRYTQAKLIAITGTNGKTTTTLLTYHLLKEAGCKVGLAGNVGESLAKQVIDDRVDYYVIEMSSFQIEGISTMAPDIVVLLNITPDHLDRYEYNFSKYSDAKFRLVKQLKEQGILVYFADDQEIVNQLNSAAAEFTKHDVSLQKATASAHAKDGKMTFAEYSIAQRDTTLRGKHNNAPHRLEYVATIQHVDFYNDSKATNVEATKYALESFDEHMVWIAGGVDKGNNYTYIMEQVNAKVKALVCLGKDNEKIREAFHKEIIKVLETDNINEAVRLAMKYAQVNDVVLLSPACASFDLFNNYEDRGNQFRKAVMMLKETYDN